MLLSLPCRCAGISYTVLLRNVGHVLSVFFTVAMCTCHMLFPVDCALHPHSLQVGICVTLDWTVSDSTVNLLPTVVYLLLTVVYNACVRAPLIYQCICVSWIVEVMSIGAIRVVRIGLVLQCTSSVAVNTY